MTEEEIEIAGFNHGYLLAMKAPKLFKEYLPILNSLSPYAQAYRKGARHAIDKKKQMDEMSKTQAKKNKGKDKGFEM